MNSWLAGFFAHPLSLLTLLAVAVPIIIHLLTKSRGKIVKFAYTQLIPDAQQKPVTQVLLSEPLSLLLRIILLALLSLLLAQPLTSELSAPSSAKPLVIVSHSWLQQASTQQRQQLSDTLSNEQAVLLDGERVKKLSAEQIRQWQAQQQRGKSTSETPGNIWEALHQVSLSYPHKQKFEVYSTDSLSQFAGARLPLSKPISWHILAAKEPTQAELADIPVKVTVVTDNPSSTLTDWQVAFDLIRSKLLPQLEVNYLQLSQYDPSQPTDWLLNLTTLSVSAEVASLDNLKQSTGRPEFPMLLAEKILAPLQLALNLSRQRLSHQQITLTEDSQTINQQKKTLQTIATGKPFNQRQWSGTPWLIALIMLLFCLERWASEYQRSNKQTQRGPAE